MGRLAFTSSPMILNLIAVTLTITTFTPHRQGIGIGFLPNCGQSVSSWLKLCRVHGTLGHVRELAVPGKGIDLRTAATISIG